jgi:hypothetical protein
MPDEIVVTVSWGPREETPTRCAERLLDSLSRIPALPDVYSDWYLYPEGGADGPDDLLPVPTDLDALASLLGAGVLRNDRGATMPGSGFSSVLTRLHRDRPIDYRVRCGVESSRVSNHILLKFPHPNRADPAAIDENIVQQSLMALVEAWQPEYGSAITHSFRTAQKINHKAKEIPVGWVTYLANSVAIDEPKLPDLSRITRTGDGMLLQLHGTVQEPSLDEALGIRRALGYEVQ